MRRFQVRITYTNNPEFVEMREFDATSRGEALERVMLTIGVFERHVVESLTVKEI